MSINTLINNSTVLQELASAINPPPGTSALITHELQQLTNQSGDTINISDNLLVGLIANKTYLIQVSFSSTASGAVPMSIIVNDNLSTPLSISVPANTWDQAFTVTFKYTSLTTGAVTFDITASVVSPATLTTDTGDYYNIVFYTL
jgi:hypothetical protein